MAAKPKCRRCQLGTPHAIRHGTPSGYVYHSCRCRECRDWSARYRREGNTLHGTEKCRCSKCLGERRLQKWSLTAKKYCDLVNLARSEGITLTHLQAWMKKEGIAPPRYLDEHIRRTKEERRTYSRNYQRSHKYPGKPRISTQEDKERMRLRRTRNLDQTRRSDAAKHKRRQNATMPTAFKRGQPWSPEDDKLLMESINLLVIEQAILLGRTAKGVDKRRRILLGEPAAGSSPK